MAEPGRRILVGAAGSIAAVKTPELVRLLVEDGHSVQCVLTRGAQEFVSALALSTFTGNETVTGVFGPDAHKLPHIVHAEQAELMVVAPASAALLAHFATGLADDIVTLCYITTKAPLLIAPAMHPTMWEHPSTQANVKTLRDRGAQFIGPYFGPLADKTHGDGRMSEPEEIAKAAEKILSKIK